MEYEYSFKVKELEPYITYCEENGYRKTKDIEQEGKEFKGPDKTVARIKILKQKNGEVSKVLDFKEDDESAVLIKNRRESLPLEFEDENAVMSVLEFLGYTKPNGFYTRTRIVYEKGNVKFEMDFYHESKNKVMAIEGEKEQVDKVYEQIKDIELKHGKLKF